MKITFENKVAPQVSDDYKVTSNDINEIKRVVNTNWLSLKGKILWTNPNPDIEFASKNVTLLTSDYDIYEVFYKTSVSENLLTSSKSIKGVGITLYGIGVRATNTPMRVRNASYVSDTTLNFDNGYTGTNQTTTVSNTICVPQFIIGYKND